MNPLFPIHIHCRDNAFRATTALEKLASDPDRINAQLRDIADSYARAIATVQEALADAKRGSGERGKAYWRAGQAIIDYEDALNAAGFYLAAQDITFAHDLGMNAGTLRKIIAYRRRNPDVNALDANTPWEPPRRMMKR